ncbi:MAG: hypothetical protein K6U89_14505, partial [Chloroflexi bacterium]|nr:hypothetical protein [Chloroflexota bacterium]
MALPLRALCHFSILACVRDRRSQQIAERREECRARFRGEIAKGLRPGASHAGIPDIAGDGLIPVREQEDSDRPLLGAEGDEREDVKARPSDHMPIGRGFDGRDFE